jgi:hypothetical protein
MSNYTAEQIQAVKATYPTLTDEQIMQSLDKAAAKAAKKNGKGAAIKGATPTIGAEAKPVPTPVATPVAVPKGESAKLSFADFTLKAIRALRKPPYKGIHSVFSGYNQAVMDYYSWPKATVFEAVATLEKEGVIATRPVKGSGVMLYEAKDAPVSSHSSAGTLAKILS